ncbi:hypothetical protein [Fervidobacterium islandicum]|uniref:hypothetical protein n=1 Tax=Fervidobacterium islandicum TaxID=2423 RepID=UPI003A66E3C3
MDINEVWRQAMMFGICYPEYDDIGYLKVINEVAIQLADVPTAQASFDRATKRYKVEVGRKFLEEICEGKTFEEAVLITRNIIKHELDHIIFGHLLMHSKKVTVSQERLSSLGFFTVNDVVIDFDNPIHYMLYNIAADSIINSKHDAFRKHFTTVVAEEFLKPEQNHSNAVAHHTLLFNTVNYTAEDLTAALILLYRSMYGDDNIRTIEVLGISKLGDILSGDVQLTDKEQLSEHEREMIRQLHDKISTHFNRGNERVQSNIEYQLTGKNVVNWEKFIRGLLTSALTENVRVNKHRIDKRYGLPPKMQRMNTAKVLALVDTSGSISDRLLNMLVSQLYYLRTHHSVEVNVFGYSIGVFPIKLGQKIVVQERGGTSLSDALAQLKSENKRVLQDNNLVVVMTDGYDAFPQELVRIKGKKLFVFSYYHSAEFMQEASRHGKVVILPEEI